MQGTEVVVQPRSSNTWGPLSLDHVYEFMGGMTLAVRAKTGVDPTGYFNDLRKRGRAKATTAVGAIREEARTTLWNPKFIQGMQREGASAAASLTETVRNMYGWNVMQPSAIGRDMWDETYAVLIDDKHDLAMREYFEAKNPYALQNMTSILLETARKGYWAPSDEVLQNLAKIHVELVQEFGAACSYETCGNRKLQEFIEGRLIAPGSEAAPETLASYQAALAGVLESSRPLPDVEGIAMEEKSTEAAEPAVPVQSGATLPLAAWIMAATVALLIAGFRRSTRVAA
jgi:cobaltochelatase CobN